MSAKVTREHRELAWYARYPWAKDVALPLWAEGWAAGDEILAAGNLELETIALAIAKAEARGSVVDTELAGAERAVVELAIELLKVQQDDDSRIEVTAELLEAADEVQVLRAALKGDK